MPQIERNSARAFLFEIRRGRAKGPECRPPPRRSRRSKIFAGAKLLELEDGTEKMGVLSRFTAILVRLFIPANGGKQAEDAD